MPRCPHTATHALYRRRSRPARGTEPVPWRMCDTCGSVMPDESARFGTARAGVRNGGTWEGGMMNTKSLPPCPHGLAHFHGPETYGHTDPCPTRLEAAYGTRDFNTVSCAIPYDTLDRWGPARDPDAIRRLWNVAYGNGPTDGGPWMSDAHRSAHGGLIRCPNGPGCHSE